MYLWLNFYPLFFVFQMSEHILILFAKLRCVCIWYFIYLKWKKVKGLDVSIAVPALRGWEQVLSTMDICQELFRIISLLHCPAGRPRFWGFWAWTKWLTLHIFEMSSLWLQRSLKHMLISDLKACLLLCYFPLLGFVTPWTQNMHVILFTVRWCAIT